ncbi:MAG: M1 family metallopeptidase [Calditrichaeota bacterium]|nr:M1 family metallopeptidase [Calditrichota bacterium]MCB9369478.1 M1 family metallopeptidase [Calditrichota bacterium]
MMRLLFLLTLCGALWANTLPALDEETPPANPTEFHNREAVRWHKLDDVRERRSLDETQADYDVTYYELWLDLRNFSGQQISGSTNIHGQALSASFRDVVLDFCDAMSVDSVRGALGEVLSYSRANYQITVTLERDYALNEPFMLTIHYHGTPCLDGGIETFDWWNRPVGSYNVPSIATLSEPFGAPGWWPCKDLPDDKADSARVHLIVADTLTATSNGTLESISALPANSRQFNWFESNPISTYLICASASNYVSFSDWYVTQSDDSLPLEYYVYPEKLSQSMTDFSIMPAAIAALAERFGEYPFMDEKYGHTMFRWGGAMEHQCNTSYGRGLVTGTHAYDWILVHELGHQWWGDMVTIATWPHIWLNEGFASYCEALYYEELGGMSAYTNYMVNSQPVSDPSGPIVNPSDLFSGNTVYNKGAWVLHTLRGAIDNDSLFFTGMRHYRAQHEYGNATTEEFLSDMSDVVGYDVTPFAQAYLYEVNRPTYRYSYGSGMVDGVMRTAVRLRQIHTTPPVPFVNRVELQFGSAQTVTESVVCDSYRDKYLFDLGYTPSSLAFDPNSWFLKSVFNEALQPIFLNAELTVGTEGQTYADTLVAIGSGSGFVYSVIGGTLPDGITLASTGELSGTPTEYGDFGLTFRVNNSINQADTTELVLTVLPSLGTPVDLTIVANEDSSVTLRWPSVVAAADYEIQAATQADYSDLTPIATVSDTFYTDSTSTEQKFYIIVANP